VKTGVSKKEMKLIGIIQTFEPIFERMGITYSQEAALYHVLTISNSALNFSETLREARKIRRTISQRGLKNGRDCLLNKGFLARVLFMFSHDAEEEPELEQKNYYIPLHPEIVFKENEAYLREIYEHEDFSVKQKQVENFYFTFEGNYGKYGLKTEKGCVTLYYTDKWIVSYITSLIAKLEAKTVSMMLSGLRVFKPPYRRYYVDKIKTEKDLKIRVVFGEEEDMKEIEEAKCLRNAYEKNVEIRYNPVINRTCKSFIIDGELAMDGKKLLAIDRNRNEPSLSHIGIMYIQ
jgi:hypothetical protein